jgi:tRNA A-37 threonylcarbamoyl transferase component Bud32
VTESELPPSLRESHRLLSRGGVRLLVRRDWEAALPVEAMLDGAPLAEWGTPVAHDLSGRGAIHVLATPRGEIVAKQMQRGGLAGGLLRRRFLDPERPVREAEAAELLAARGLLTPPVVAARASLAGGLWVLELATARLAAQGDLLAVLRSGLAAPGLAAALGRTLRAAHDAGLRHRDLQVKNLLVLEAPAPAVAILDLDRCSVGAPLGTEERIAELARLGRSLVKHGVLPPAGALRSFARAYAADGEPRAAELLRRVEQRTARAVKRHRPLWPRATG